LTGGIVHRLTHLGRLLAEIGRYAAQHKAWWLIPMVIVLLLLALLIVTGQATAPFIYTLF
jgi:ABC-type dipeptide/oligopeptide/nickel transport system permease subunit